MLNRDDIKTEIATATTDGVNVGSAVPQNMRRFIYKIKATNLHTAANLLTIGKIEDGAAEEDVDYIQFAVQYGIWQDPDDLLENSAPVYIVEGKKTADSYLRATTESGTAYVTIWYIDAPA